MARRVRRLCSFVTLFRRMRLWQGLLKLLVAVAGVALVAGTPASAAPVEPASITAVEPATGPGVAEVLGLMWVSSSDPRPSVLSRPLEIVIGRSAITRSVMQEVRLEIEGFALNPGQTTGEQIGSVDYYTDDETVSGGFITTADDGTYRLPVNVRTAHIAFPAVVASATGMDETGMPVPRRGSTLLSFTIPQLLLGAKLRQLMLGFNVVGIYGSRDGSGRALTPAVGVTNPPSPGTYWVRAWVRTSDGVRATSSFPVKIYAGPPVRVRARRVGRGPVRVGQPIRLRIAASPGVPTTVSIRHNRYGSLSTGLMGPGERSAFTYYPTPEERGHVVRLAVWPDSGQPKIFAVRVKAR